MKNTTLKKELRSKDSRVYGKGHAFSVSMIGTPIVPVNDTFAIADPMDGSKPMVIRAIRLGKYFRGFINVNVKKMYGDEDSHMLDSSVCDSLTGAQVEPDGHDEYGFPSVLLAAGYV